MPFAYSGTISPLSSKTISQSIVVVLLFISFVTTFAQEGKSKLIHSKAITIGAGYTYVPKGADLNSNETEGVWVPTISLDYNSRIGDGEWVWGLMFDYEMDHYLVFKKELERENAIIIVPGVGYHIIRHSLLFVGAGIEFEHHKNLPVLRLGLEQGIHISEKFKLSPAVCYDFKKEYDTFAVSLGAVLAF